MSVLMEFAMFPTDKGASVAPYVTRIVKYLKNSPYSYQLTPMGSIIECDSMSEATKILDEAYKLLEPDCDRVYSSIKFDIRKGKENRMEQKIASVDRELKED
ncbi:MAG: MTH1187 family thiamine-binding protein [Campylobacterales bacterium]